MAWLLAAGQGPWMQGL